VKLRFLTFIYIFSLVSNAQSVRKYSNEFLNIGVNANALAMGKAVVSNVNDVTAGYWNPAGLTQLEDSEISLMHASYFANIAQYDYIGFAKPIDKNATIGFSLLRFGVDDILDTTELIDSEGNIDYNRIKLFSAADYAFLFSYARRPLMKDFSWGINAKIVHRRIGKFATSIGFGFDAGLQYQNENWSYGVMLRDITTTYNSWTINDEEFKKIQNAIPNQNQELPETTELTIPKMQLGLGKKWEITRDIALQSNLDLNVRFTETNDLIHTSFAGIEPALGLEANYLEMIYVRVGLNNIQHTLEFDNTQSLSLQPNIGVGFEYNGIHIDYALTNIASVGNALYSNIFSLKIDFESFR
jgi:hypothetical protein